MNNTSSSSPNDTDSSEPRNARGNPMSVHDHDIMNTYMDSSSSSSLSMPAMVNSNGQMDAFSMLMNNSYDVTGAPCLFDLPPCLTQMGIEDGFHGDFGMLEANSKMGLERDLSLPPLESISTSTEENNAVSNYSISMKGNIDTNHFNDYCLGNTDHRFKGGNMVGFENHNWHGENLKVGEWDLDGLMENLSSFPILDFQVAGVPQFGLAEGVDSRGVTTKILTCNCSINLLIENKSRVFGLHIHPPILDMSFGHLLVAISHGTTLYAEAHGLSSFQLYVGTSSKPMYGAGRNMQDMLDSGQGLPILVRVSWSSDFRVVWNLIKPKFRHQARCLLVLQKSYDKQHRTQVYHSSCAMS